MLINRISKRTHATWLNGTEINGTDFFTTNIPYLGKLASIFAMEADSYRVPVGAVMVAENEERGEIGVFAAANDKPFRSVLKRCAEPKLLREARKTGFLAVTGLLIVGPSDPDTVGSINQLVTPTLLPCNECCHCMGYFQREQELELPDSSPFVTKSLTTRKAQVHTLGEIMLLQGHGSLEDENNMPPEHVIMASDDLWHALSRDMPRSCDYVTDGISPGDCVAMMRRVLVTTST